MNVEKYFKRPEFVNQPTKISENVQWALHTGGPAYCAVPTPKECTVDHADPDFIVYSSLFVLPL